MTTSTARERKKSLSPASRKMTARGGGLRLKVATQLSCCSCKPERVRKGKEMARAEARLTATHGGRELKSSPAERSLPDRAEEGGGGEIEEGNGPRAPRGGPGRCSYRGRGPLATLARVDVDTGAAVRGSLGGGPWPPWKGDGHPPLDQIGWPRYAPRTASLASLCWAAGR